MEAQDVLGVIAAFEQARLDVWLDGGWGVDALLGEQTREHDDVDIVVRIGDVLKITKRFGALGFHVIEGEPPHHFVLGDAHGRKIDVHAVRFDLDGGGVYHMESGRNWVYPAEGFAGKGTINGRVVRCLTPEVQVLCHGGYDFDENDYRDMKALHERFGVELLPHQVRSTPHEA